MNIFKITHKAIATLGVLLALVVSANAQLNVSIAVTNPTCAGYTNSSLVVTVSGGQQPYSYVWSDGDTGAQRYGVAAGTYSVTVSDANGIESTATAAILSPDPVVLTIQTSGDVCTGNPTYNFVGSGGTPPYTYTWDGAAVGGSVSNATPGYHYAGIRDANGCESGAGVQSLSPLAVTVRTQDVVCNGYCDGTVEAQVSGGSGTYSFSWSNGSNEQIVYGLDPGTYTVLVTDIETGCVVSGSGTLTEPDAITFTVTLDEQCVGGTFANVVAQGGTGILEVRWSTGTIGDRAFLPEGQHFVYITDENGCQVSDGIVVSDGIESVVTMNVDATCDDGGASLLCITGGRGPFTYIWRDAQGNIVANTIEATNLAPGIYTYDIIDGGGCTFSGVTMINGVDPATCCEADAGMLVGGGITDTACVDITLTVMLDNPGTLPAGFSATYILTDASGLILQTGIDPFFVVTEGGTYTISRIVFDPTLLDINTLSTIGEIVNFIIPNTDICASLTGSPEFIVPACPNNPAGCSGGNPGSLTASPVCFDGSPTTLVPTVISTPTAPAGYEILYLLASVPGDTILQVSSDSIFTVTSDGMYSIRTVVYNPDSINLSDINLINTTLGSLGLSLTTCDALADNIDAAQFNVEAFNPTFPSSLADVSCAGETVTLNPGGDDSYTYVWSPASGLSDPNAVSPTVTLLDTTTYTVEITQIVGGIACSVSRDYQVNIAEIPSVATADNIITCNGEEVDLLASSSIVSDVEWSNQADFSTILSTDPTLTVTSGDPATYFVRATSPEGCTSSAAQVTVGDYPVDAAVGDDYTICLGDQASIDVDGVVGNPNSFILFNSIGEQLDSAGTGGFVFSPEINDSYSIIVSNQAGCSDTVSIGIDISEVAVELLADMRMDTSIYPGNTINLQAFSNGATSFTFDTDPTYLITRDSSASVMPTETTVYSVTGMNEFGCTQTAQVTVNILEFVCDRPYLFVPNASSPDGDGINDIFYIDGVNIREAYYAIYNRWGELVFESNAVGNDAGWDGTFRGQQVDPDVYGIYVKILCNDGEEFFTRGNVTILR